MKNLRRLRFCLMIALLIAAVQLMGTTTIFAEESNEVIKKAQETFTLELVNFYNHQDDYLEIDKRLETAKGQFNQLTDSLEKYYWMAKYEFLQGEISEVVKDLRNAGKRFEKSCELAEKALSYDAKNSDVNRLLGDGFVRLIQYKGFLFAMKNGAKASKLLEEAIRLDPNNFEAKNSNGSYLLFTPAIAGGSPDKAIKALNEALKSKNSHDNFISYVWLGYSYVKKKDEPTAREQFRKALEIYPDSPWVHELLEKLDKGIDIFAR